MPSADYGTPTCNLFHPDAAKSLGMWLCLLVTWSAHFSTQADSMGQDFCCIGSVALGLLVDEVLGKSNMDPGSTFADWGRHFNPLEDCITYHNQIITVKSSM